MTPTLFLTFLIEEAAEAFMHSAGLTRRTCNGALRTWFESDQRRRYIDQTRNLWRVN